MNNSVTLCVDCGRHWSGSPVFHCPHCEPDHEPVDDTATDDYPLPDYAQAEAEPW